MRVAVASDGGQVSAHFGHCAAFTLYETEADGRLAKEVVPNPGHRPGYLRLFLKERGCDVVIAGGMGEAAVAIFAQHGIEVVVGARGAADAAAEAYLRGELHSTGDVCEGHETGSGRPS